MSLRNKLVLLTVVPVVLVITALVWVALHELRSRLIEAETEKMLGELSNAAKVIDRGTREAVAVARLMATAQRSGLFGIREDTVQLTREVLADNPQFIGTSIGYEPNADGGDRAYLARVGADHPSTDSSGRFLPYWFRDMTQGGELTLEPLVKMESSQYYAGLREQYRRNPNEGCIVTEPYIYNEQNLIVEQTCVIAINGEFRGVAGVDRGLDTLADYLKALRPAEKAELVLVSGQGRIITTSLGGDSERALRTARVEDIYLKPGGEIVTDIFHIVDGKKEVNPRKASRAQVAGFSREFQVMMERILQTAESGRVINGISPTSGLDVLGAAIRIPTGNWALAIVVPVEEVEAATRSTILWVAAVALFGILVVVWLLVRMANTLGYRIHSVGGLARSVADGDLTVEPEVDSDDETGVLQKAIQDMVLSLRSLLGKVKLSSVRLTSTSNEIGAGRRVQESAIENFGSSTAEITTAAKQISGTSRDLLNTMSDLNQVASESAVLAGEGREGLSRMATTTDQLNEATGSIAARLAKISEKAENINVVVTTIVKVADQTNLLSLNASIEAEKAGEHGLGFSVVAQEIRRLADQTAVATLDIEEMIQQMQSSVASGVTEMSKFTGEVRRASEEVRRVGQQLESIIDEVRELTERFQTVTEGMESQAEGARQISDALVNLSDGVQQTMHTLKDYRRAGDNLDKAVRDLRGEIARFKMKSGDLPVTPVAEG